MVFTLRDRLATEGHTLHYMTTTLSPEDSIWCPNDILSKKHTQEVTSGASCLCNDLCWRNPKKEKTKKVGERMDYHTRVAGIVCYRESWGRVKSYKTSPLYASAIGFSSSHWPHPTSCSHWLYLVSTITPSDDTFHTTAPDIWHAKYLWRRLVSLSSTRRTADWRTLSCLRSKGLRQQALWLANWA